MSKLTKREYKNIAKRKGERGYGYTGPKRVGKAQQEADRPDAEAAAVKTFRPELIIIDDPMVPGTGITVKELFDLGAELDAEEILTDLGEQERVMDLENDEEIYEGVA